MTPHPGGDAAYGSLAWALGNDGRLTGGEKARETAKAAARLTTSAPATVRAMLKRPQRNATRFVYGEVIVPDSRFAQAALEEARDSVSEPVVQHSLRTYYWGMMLAARDGIAPDPETAYVAAMLHDITWGGKYRGFAPDGAAPLPCFAARGAQVALDWGSRVGWPAEQAQTAADAISRHLNVVVGDESSGEARVVAHGAAMDVIAQRYDELTQDTIDAVLEHHPRTGWLEAIRTFADESHPGTRAALLRRLGMVQLSRLTPFGR